MATIESVTINYLERNYFDDCDELRSDMMFVPKRSKVIRAIDKLARRYRRYETCDCMFVTYDDKTGYRLIYDYSPHTFDPKTSVKELRLRHYTNMLTYSWDTEKTVTAAQAKHAIVG